MSRKPHDVYTSTSPLLTIKPDGSPFFRLAYDGLQKDFSDLTATDFTISDPDDAKYHPSRSLTSQAEAHDLDINVIMSRYQKTGVVPMSLAEPFFGDASALPDFQQAQHILIEANMAFESLPSNIRDRFLNDPARFLAFMGDEANSDEAIKLGLVKAPTELPPADAAAERPQKAGVAKASPEPPKAPETPKSGD